MISDGGGTGSLPGRRSTGNLDGWGTDWQAPGADSAEDTHEYTQSPDASNELKSVTNYDVVGGVSTGGSTNHTNSQAGHLQHDGAYHYFYDAWGRLVHVYEDSDTSPNSPGMRIREYVYDGFGRLIQTTSPMDGGGDYVERFVYDGTRRVQQFANANNAGEQLKREYIWSPVGGVDELLVEYEGDRDVGDVQGFYAIHDIAGDLVALCDLNGGATHKARVVGQWTYDAYGGVLTAEQIQANMPLRHIGHKGLFIDRLDAPAADNSGDELLRLIPYGHNVYHNRNRVYAPAMGRFLQRDPNQSALAVLGGSHSGR
ncbi:MAG: hypothetical protein AAFP26_10340, partial [Planctomycetota bacterium]